MKFIMALTLIFCFSLSTKVVLANNDLAQTDVEMVADLDAGTTDLAFAVVDFDASALFSIDLGSDLGSSLITSTPVEVCNCFVLAVSELHRTIEKPRYNKQNTQARLRKQIFLRPREKITQN